MTNPSASFAGISFEVFAGDGRVPVLSAAQSDTPPQWSGTILVASLATLTALRAKLTIVTWQPVLYTTAWNGTNHNGGPGLATLTVPASGGSMTSYQAVLSSIDNIVTIGLSGESFFADVTFTVPAP